MANKDMPPNLAHPMGRTRSADIMTLAYGGRISLTIGLLATAVGILTARWSAVAGFYGGWVDNALCV